MRGSATALAAAVLFAAGIVSSCGTAEMSAEDLWMEITATNGSFVQSFNAGQADGVAALYTRDARLFTSDNDTMDGRAAIQEFWAVVYTLGNGARIERTTEEVEGSGDLAYEVGSYKIYNAGGETEHEGKYMVIWKKTLGGWKLHRDIFNHK